MVRQSGTRNRRSSYVQVRLSPAERRDLERTAAKQGRSLSAVIRRALGLAS